MKDERFGECGYDLNDPLLRTLIWARRKIAEMEPRWAEVIQACEAHRRLKLESVR
jgi:hypothetical protein